MKNSSFCVLCAVGLVHSGCTNLPTDLNPSHAGVGRTITIKNSTPDTLSVTEQFTDRVVCCSIDPGELHTVSQLWYDLSSIKITVTDAEKNIGEVIWIEEDYQRLDFKPFEQSYSICLTNLVALSK